MSKMLAEIRRIVIEDVSNRIHQYDVMHEAITNAIHANATEDFTSWRRLLPSQFYLSWEVKEEAD